MGLILSSDMVNSELDRGSIPLTWVLSGHPETQSKLLGKTRDGLAHVMLWECGAASFRWHYSKDEVFIILSGEAFLKEDGGRERRFAAGDVAFFPAGSDATWRIPDHVRKVAVLKNSVWFPVAFISKVPNKLLEVLGLSKKSGL